MIILLSGCFEIYERGEPIFERRIEKYDSGKIKLECDGYLVKNYDDEGKLIETYGNTKEWDNDLNFKEIHFYQENQLIETHTFFFEDSTDFAIHDSSEYRNDKYYYSNSEIELLLRFFPDYDSIGYSGKRILGFWENKITNKSGTDKDLKLETQVLDTDEKAIKEVADKIRE